MATKSEHEYRGSKIRITSHTAGAGWSAMIEVWEAGQDPGNHPGVIVPFRKRLPSEAEARAVALLAS